MESAIPREREVSGPGFPKGAVVDGVRSFPWPPCAVFPWKAPRLERMIITWWSEGAWKRSAVMAVMRQLVAVTTPLRKTSEDDDPSTGRVGASGGGGGPPGGGPPPAPRSHPARDHAQARRLAQGGFRGAWCACELSLTFG
jgi:hypothetical protein